VEHPVLATVSRGYPRAEGRFLTCYSPVRRFQPPEGGFDPRLACVKPAASVRPEPGSNSPLRDRCCKTTFNGRRGRRSEDQLIHLHLKGSTTHRSFRALASASRSTGLHRFASVRYWLLAPCAVLKERGRGPRGSAHGEVGRLPEETPLGASPGGDAQLGERSAVGPGFQLGERSARRSGARKVPRRFVCCQLGSSAPRPASSSALDLARASERGRPRAVRARGVGARPRLGADRGEESRRDLVRVGRWVRRAGPSAVCAT
jgi:hypothetical protein